jgi:hypothetical protein
MKLKIGKFYLINGFRVFETRCNSFTDSIYLIPENQNISEKAIFYLGKTVRGDSKEYHEFYYKSKIMLLSASYEGRIRSFDDSNRTK